MLSIHKGRYQSVNIAVYYHILCHHIQVCVRKLSDYKYSKVPNLNICVKQNLVTNQLEFFLLRIKLLKFIFFAAIAG